MGEKRRQLWQWEQKGKRRRGREMSDDMMRGRGGGGVGRRMTSTVVIVHSAQLRVYVAACRLRWRRMTSIWDIFQSSGLVESTALSWRGRERAERAAERETRRENTKRATEEVEEEGQKCTETEIYIHPVCMFR